MFSLANFTLFLYNLYFLFLNYWFCNFFFFNSNIIDLYYKIPINEAFINLIHFFWVNFLFIFMLSAVVYLILTYQTLFYISNLILFNWIFTYNYYLETINLIIIINKTNFFFNFFLNNYNVFLFNNLNKYHPILFYINFLLLFVITFFFFIIKFYKNIFIKFYYKIIFDCLCINFLISFLLLFLGSWWAFQENTWGGWWNWDFSELFGLFFLIIILALIHIKFYTFNLIFFKNQILFFLIILFFFYFLIQLNFSVTSHNFGLNFFFFFNSNFFYVEIMYILIYMIFILTKKQLIFAVINNLIFYKIIKIIYKHKQSFNFFFNLYIWLLIIFYISFSFNFLIYYLNQVLINFWHMHIIFNFKVILYFTNILLILHFFIYIYAYFFLFLAYTYSFLFIFIINFYFITITGLLHFFVINFLLINQIIFNQDLLFLFYQNFLYFFNFSVSITVYTINYDFYESNNYVLLNHQFNNIWSYLYNTDIFNFFFSNNESYLKLINFINNFIKIIYIQNKSNNSLYYIFCIIWLIYSKNLLKKTSYWF